jgi:DNA-binding response OmpR family regulator
MRLLVIEDDDLIGSAVQKGLTRSGYAVDWIQAGRDAAVAIGTHEYDSVLLDLGLPDICGEALLKSIRLRKPGLSVVVMTARGSVHDRVSLLDIGADDYLVKPVDLDELGARLRAVARRVRATGQEDAELVHGGLKLVPSRHQVLWRGQALRLTNKEYWLLETFMRKANMIVTRAQLEDTLYGWGEEIGSNTVEVYIHFLRRKIFPGVIQTVRGVGYQLGSAAAFDL